MRVSPWYFVAAAIAALLVYLASLLFESYEEEVDVGWSREAMSNPFLAAQQYLARVSTPAESSDRLAVLEDLSADSTLVIGNANHVLSERRAEELIRWMEEGGHVIVAAHFGDGADDVLLSRFDIGKEPVDDGFRRNGAAESSGEEPAAEEPVSMRETLEEANKALQEAQQREQALEEAREESESTVAAEVRAEEALSREDNLVPLSFDGFDYELLADFSGSGSLSHPAFYLEEGESYPGPQPFYWAGNDKAITFLQMDVGAGLLTVMADVNIWTSSQIGMFDHAFLLELLVSDSERVIFLYGAVVPGLLELIWENFAELCIALGLLLLAWLVHRSRRFGPVNTIDISQRRSYREHVQAVSHFLWRQRRGDQLYRAVREDIWQQLRQRFPATEQSSEEQKLQQLAAASRQNPASLRALMLGPAPEDEIQFFQSVKTLQQIRKAL